MLFICIGFICKKLYSIWGIHILLNFFLIYIWYNSLLRVCNSKGLTNVSTTTATKQNSHMAPKIPSAPSWSTPPHTPASDNHWSAFHPFSFAFFRMSYKWIHAICSFGDLASFIVKYSLYSTGHDSLLLSFILLLMFPPLWLLRALSSWLLWSLDMSPPFFEHFLSFWHHRLVLAYFVVSLFQFENPSSIFQRAVYTWKIHSSRPDGLSSKKGSWGDSYSSPAGPKKEERWRASLTRRHWGGRSEGLRADVGSLCNLGWRRAHANIDIMHLRLLWVLVTSPNSIVCESLPRIFMTLSLGCPLYPRMPSYCLCTTVLLLPAIGSHIRVFVVMDWTNQWLSHHITKDEEPLDICLKLYLNIF